MANSTIQSLKKRQLVLSVLACILGLIGLGFAFHGIYIYGFDKNNLNLLGDYLGGTTGSFWSAASLLVVYLAFIAQALQLEMQNEEITETKSSLERQLFETTFFNLLNLHSSTVRDIDMSNSHGKDCIRLIMNELKSLYNNVDGESIDERIENSLKELVVKHSLDISTYFNSLMPLILLVEGKEEQDYKYYSSLISSQLSCYELALLFYYSRIDDTFSEFVTKNQIYQKVANQANSKSLLLN